MGPNEDEDDEKFNLSYRKTKRRADAMDLDEDMTDVTTSKKHRVNNMDNFLNDEADEDDDEINDNNISLSKFCASNDINRVKRRQWASPY